MIQGAELQGGWCVVMHWWHLPSGINHWWKSSMVETIALYTLRSKVRVRMKLTEMIFKLESGIYTVNPDTKLRHFTYLFCRTGPTLIFKCMTFIPCKLDVNYSHRLLRCLRFPSYLSCTCGWEVSSADLCADGSSEPCVDPGQTWWSRNNKGRFVC